MQRETWTPTEECVIDKSVKKPNEIFDINDNKSSDIILSNEIFSDDKNKTTVKKKKKKRVTIKWKVRFKKKKSVKRKSSTAPNRISKMKMNEDKKEIENPDLELLKTETCETCGKSFHSMHGLKSHTRMAHGLFSYRCEICDRTFKAEQYLMNHVKIHTNKVKNHLYNLCDENDSNKKTFIALQNVHKEGKDNVTCAICKKTMLLKSSLRRHIRQQHSDESIEEEKSKM